MPAGVFEISDYHTSAKFKRSERLNGRQIAYGSCLKMVNIAKLETLHNNLWDRHGEVEIFSGRSEDNKSASDNNDCVPSEAQTEPCLLDRNLLSLC